MSFREIRNFTEAMRALGYPRVISLNNFRNPNFELVADCLFWLVKRYDPGTEIVDSISTEQERIVFLQEIARVMLVKARLKLNIKRLYAADGHAVKELLKIAVLLHKATIVASEQSNTGPLSTDSLSSWSLKTLDVKSIRQLTSEITQCGALLHDALKAEPGLREARIRAVNFHINTEDVEQSVQEAIREADENIRSQTSQLNEIKDTSSKLESKILKRKSEMERCEKRLATLQGVRPAYMDDYEKLQEELQNLYTQYFERCRNLQFLQSELDQYQIAEQERIEVSNRKMKKMQNKLRDEELRILRGEEGVDESNIEVADDSEESESDGACPQGAGVEAMMKRDASEPKMVDGRQVIGDIRGGDDEESDPDESLSINDDTGTYSSNSSLKEKDSQDGSEDILNGDEFEDQSDVGDLSDDNF